MDRCPPLKIFLAHASEDFEKAKELYNQLKMRGYQPWQYKFNLNPGSMWQEEIPKKIRESNVVIILFSKNSINKNGYIQQEIRMTLNEYDKRIHHNSGISPFLIPIKLEELDIPDITNSNTDTKLKGITYLNYWGPHKFEKLIRSIETSNSKIKIPPDSPPKDKSKEDKNKNQVINRRIFLASCGLAIASTSTLIYRLIGELTNKYNYIETKNIKINNHEEVHILNKDGSKIDTYKPNYKSFTEDLGNNVSIEMISIPSGSFQMGSLEGEEGRKSFESKQHHVRLHEFYMSKYPITQEQWHIISEMPEEEINLDINTILKINKNNYPVEGITWYQAKEFCRRLSKYSKGQYQLPTEAQWEYACRGNTTTPFYCGETITPEYANYNYNYNYANETIEQSLKENSEKGSSKVSLFPPNPFGLCDMHGNLFEWCEDIWHRNYKNAPTNGDEPWIEKYEQDEEDYKLRVLRGGTWGHKPQYCRSASRFRSYPHDSNDGIGFRIVLRLVT